METRLRLMYGGGSCHGFARRLQPYLYGVRAESSSKHVVNCIVDMGSHFGYSLLFGMVLVTSLQARDQSRSSWNESRLDTPIERGSLAHETRRVAVCRLLSKRAKRSFFIYIQALAMCEHFRDPRGGMHSSGPILAQPLENKISLDVSLCPQNELRPFQPTPQCLLLSPTTKSTRTT